MRTTNQTNAASLSSQSSFEKSTSPAPARVSRFAFALTAALFVSSATVQAQTWQTVDDAEGPGGESVYRITSDSAGNIFAAGNVYDATGLFHAVITKSSDSGATWETVVDYPAVDDHPPMKVFAYFAAIASADVGGERHLVAAGKIREVATPGLGYRAQMLIIRSRDDGATWETLDEYLHPSYESSASSRDVAVDANGNIYVAGLAVEGYYPAGKSHWLIRKGLMTSSGMTWSTVGDFSYAEAYDNYGYAADGPSGVACVGSSVFVVGGGAGSWIVRKSSNGGSTWQVVDTFRYNRNGKSHPFGIAADSAGNVYVAGFGNKTVNQWFVRRGTNGGTNGGTKWSTVDQFTMTSGTSAEARGIAVDANNNVHVTGLATSTQKNWVTRQRSAATGAWSTSDLFSMSANRTTEGKSITADPAGNLFAAGFGADSAGALHGWLVRRKPAP